MHDHVLFEVIFFEKRLVAQFARELPNSFSRMKPFFVFLKVIFFLEFFITVRAGELPCFRMNKSVVLVQAKSVVQRLVTIGALLDIHTATDFVPFPDIRCSESSLTMLATFERSFTCMSVYVSH